MDKKTLIKRFSWLLAPTVFLICFSYFYIDKTVAIWISQHQLRSIKLLKYCSQIPDAFIALVPCFYIITLSRFLSDKWASRDSKLLMFANTIAITQFWKVFFKFFFGRYWPETWINNNPSLILNNAYGFNFFHKGDNFGAFPSGHAATLVAGITLLWLLAPNGYIAYSIVLILGVIGIVGMNYHFVSDVIAGAFLGYIVANFTYLLSQININHRS